MPQVKLYALSTCGHCKRTKQLLRDCQVEFDFVDVDLCSGDEQEAVLREVRKVNPNCTFPTLIIGDQVIVGHKEDEIKEALGL